MEVGWLGVAETGISTRAPRRGQARNRLGPVRTNLRRFRAWKQHLPSMPYLAVCQQDHEYPHMREKWLLSSMGNGPRLLHHDQNKWNLPTGRVQPHSLRSLPSLWVLWRCTDLGKILPPIMENQMEKENGNWDYKGGYMSYSLNSYRGY